MLETLPRPFADMIGTRLCLQTPPRNKGGRPRKAAGDAVTVSGLRSRRWRQRQSLGAAALAEAAIIINQADQDASCRLFQQVAGLPSLASWVSMRVFLAAAAATSV